MRDLSAYKDITKSHTFPGGYELYYITAACTALSYDAVIDNMEEVRDAVLEPGSNIEWEILSGHINWEEENLYCEHTGKQIKPEYSE